MAIPCLLSPWLAEFVFSSRVREITLLADECQRIDESKWAHVSLVNELVTERSLCKHRINECGFADEDGQIVELLASWFVVAVMILTVLNFQPLSRTALTRTRHRSVRKGIKRCVFATVPSIAVARCV